jgi:hypothetical protein
MPGIKGQGKWQKVKRQGTRRGREKRQETGDLRRVIRVAKGKRHEKT